MAGKTDDNIEELEILTYDGLRMNVGRTSDRELESIFGQRGRRGEIYSGLKALADHYGRLVRKQYPDDSPAGFRIQPQLSAAGKRLPGGARAGRV